MYTVTIKAPLKCTGKSLVSFDSAEPIRYLYEMIECWLITLYTESNCKWAIV